MEAGITFALQDAHEFRVPAVIEEHRDEERDAGQAAGAQNGEEKDEIEKRHARSGGRARSINYKSTPRLLKGAWRIFRGKSAV
jgi:hypothetical protein